MATTTNMYSGLSDGKPSSKVLAPPGGKSNISFGGYEPENTQKAQPQQKVQPSPFAQQQDCGPAKPIIPQSSSAGFNLLTGEPQAAANNSNQRGGAQPKIDPVNMSAAGGRLGEREVTRKNPPGGFSSFSFGGD